MGACEAAQKGRMPKEGRTALGRKVRRTYYFTSCCASHVEKAVLFPHHLPEWSEEGAYNVRAALYLSSPRSCCLGPLSPLTNSALSQEFSLFRCVLYRCPLEASPLSADLFLSFLFLFSLFSLSLVFRSSLPHLLACPQSCPLPTTRHGHATCNCKSCTEYTHSGRTAHCPKKKEEKKKKPSPASQKGM